MNGQNAFLNNVELCIIADEGVMKKVLKIGKAQGVYLTRKSGNDRLNIEKERCLEGSRICDTEQGTMAQCGHFTCSFSIKNSKKL